MSRKMITNKIYLIYDASGTHDGYVGWTVKTLKERLQGHFHAAMRNEMWHVSCWLRKIKYNVKIKLLETVPTNRSWAMAERKWKRYYDQLNWNLKNETEGGEGVLGLKWSKSAKVKQSRIIKQVWRKNKHPWIGRHHRPESNTKNKIAHIGKMANKATKKKMSLSQRNRFKKHPESNGMLNVQQSRRTILARVISIKAWHRAHPNAWRGHNSPTAKSRKKLIKVS